MSADFILQVAKTSLFTSLLIGILLLLVPLLQKRYRAKWRYVAWILIAVRLLIPVNLPLPQAPVKIELPERSAAVMAPAAENTESQMEILPEPNTQVVPMTENPVTLSTAPQADKKRLSPLQIISFVWLAGVLAFLLFQLCAYQIFLRKLKTSYMEVAPASIKETIWRIGVDMGICKLPEPVVTDAIDAPVLIGVIYPRILLPHARYTDEETAFILRHELVHYRRRDMWYKLVLLLANALHWFNPLVYLMTVQAAKDIELACDDDVTKELDLDARARYGDTILSALPQKRRLEPLFSTHFGSTKQNMKDRLRNLFDMTMKRRGIAALCAVAICAVTVTGVVTVGYAAAKPDSAPVIAEKQPLSIPYSFSVASIEPGEVVCIGKVELGPDISYTATMSVGSGSGWMIGLADSPDIARHADGTAWNQHYGGGSQFYFSSDKTVIRYVYVGSQYDRGTKLTNISGKFLPHESGSATAFPSTPALTGNNISARAHSGTWASATEIDGNSYQEQLDGKIRWLDAIYAEHPTNFVISETIPENEIYHMAGIQYLYNTSEVYRSMSRMKSGSFRLSDGSSFSRSGLPSGRVYDRTAVMVDSDSFLQIDAKYNLKEGKIALWLVNPSGKLVYYDDFTKDYNESFMVEGEKGLWNVITVSETENGAVSGTSNIIIKTANSNMQFKTAPSANFAVQRLGQHSLQNGDALKVALRWSGKGNVMLLYTDNNYTNDEFLMLLQGLPGIPELDNKVDHNIGGTLHFSSSATSPLVWEPKVTKSGSYYFYIVQYGFDIFNNVTGNVTIGKSNGYSSAIWQSKSEKSDSDSIRSTDQSEGDTVFQLSNNGQKSITQSGSFQAKSGQNLIVVADSNIKGGSVDFFLFSPSGQQRQRISIGGSATIKTIELSAGTWAYNCTGFFDSGNITITGKVSGTSKAKSTAADKAAYEVMQYSRSWTMVEFMLPYMTKDGIDAAVKLNNELNPNSRKTAADYYDIATPSKAESDQISYTLMNNSGNWTYASPLFPYMTNGGIDKVVALYNQKTGKNVKAADYHN